MIIHTRFLTNSTQFVLVKTHDIFVFLSNFWKRGGFSKNFVRKTVYGCIVCVTSEETVSNLITLTSHLSEECGFLCFHFDQVTCFFLLLWTLRNADLVLCGNTEIVWSKNECDAFHTDHELWSKHFTMEPPWPSGSTPTWEKSCLFIHRKVSLSSCGNGLSYINLWGWKWHKTSIHLTSPHTLSNLNFAF